MPEGLQSAAPTEAGKPRPGSLGALANAVRSVVTASTGASAALRRLNPEDAASVGALHQVLARAGVDEGALVGDGFVRYACVVSGMARMSSTEGQRQQLGKALVDLRFSEGRLARLLTARGAGLRVAALSVVRRVAHAGIPADLRPLYDLVLSEGRYLERAEEARRKIAQSYYRAASSAETEIADAS